MKVTSRGHTSHVGVTHDSGSALFRVRYRLGRSSFGIAIRASNGVPERRTP